MSALPGECPKSEITLTVNEKRVTVHAYAMDRLVDVLRTNLGLTGTKEGCGEGECGSCSVLLDGVLVNSCLIPILKRKAPALLRLRASPLTDAHWRYSRPFSIVVAPNAESALQE